MIQSINTPKLAVIFGFFIVCLLSLGLTAKTVLTANKPPKIQKVQIVNYSEILQAVELEKKELLDSIKTEIKDLRIENQTLLARANKPKVVIVKEKQTEIQTNQTNQIVVSKSYVPHVQILQKKSGSLEIIE